MFKFIPAVEKYISSHIKPNLHVVGISNSPNYWKIYTHSNVLFFNVGIQVTLSLAYWGSNRYFCISTICILFGVLWGHFVVYIILQCYTWTIFYGRGYMYALRGRKTFPWGWFTTTTCYEKGNEYLPCYWGKVILPPSRLSIKTALSMWF